MKSFAIALAAVVALSSASFAAPVFEKEKGSTTRIDNGGGSSGQNGSAGDKR